MIVCPNCNHQNPEGAGQCEACYTPLPAMTSCPNCGATVQADATFCGQCGFNLRAAGVTAATGAETPAPSEAAIAATAIPEMPESEAAKLAISKLSVLPNPAVPSNSPASLASAEAPVSANSVPPDGTENTSDAVETSPDPPVVAKPPSEPAIAGGADSGSFPKTQLQQSSARLIHVQTNTTVDLPPSLTVIHIGKPNDRIPPDIDVSGFPNSEIVSRIHADIRLEGDSYYVEDVGSSNGTYINNLPLAIGNRHRLRAGDRIGLGKGDKVTFLFQLS